MVGARLQYHFMSCSRGVAHRESIPRAAQDAGVVVPGVLDSGDWELLTWCVVVCAVHHPV